MAKFSLSSILGGYAGIDALNNNFTTLLAELQDKVLYRDNTSLEDNVMENDLDMNSNRIINLPAAILDTEPVRLGQLNLGTSDTQSAIDAGVSATAAAASLAAQEQSYLGPLASAPTVDNEGNALLEGAMYYNTTSDALFVWDGSAWVAFAQVTQGWKPIIPLFFAGEPANAQVIVRFVSPQTLALAAGLGTSYASAITAATAETVLTIKKNAVSVGTITFAIAGTTGTFSVASGVTLDAGDILTIENQATADSTLSHISITLQTEQVVGSLVTQYASDWYAGTGTANAHILTAVGHTVLPSTLEDGMSVKWKPDITNTGAVTLDLGALGATIPCYDTTGTIFSGGELVADTYTQAI